MVPFASTSARNNPMRDDPLPPALVDLIRKRFEITGPPERDIEGLRAIYRAWCRSVPFDNVRKMISLRTEKPGPLPGGNAPEFFEAWLEHGCGGTCWPTSNALYSLLAAVGFAARRVTGSMRDMGMVNHGSVKVRLEDGDWLADSSLLTEVPLPLRENVFISEDPVFTAEVEAVDGTHLIWCSAPPGCDHIPCRLLDDPADLPLYLERYEASRDRGPFNQRVYARRNREGEQLVIVGNRRYSRTSRGVDCEELSRERLINVLREEIGISAGLTDEWVRAGGLEASFEPPVGPKPPPASGLPPSQRQRLPAS